MLFKINGRDITKWPVILGMLEKWDKGPNEVPMP